MTTTVILLLYSNLNGVYAAFAASIGTKDNPGFNNDPLTTSELINTSKNYYLGLGYSPSNKLEDPGYTVLVSNLMAEVQLFATHGSYNNIAFTNPDAFGIKTGNTTNLPTTDGGHLTQLGIDDLGSNCWKNNTRLVTYIACSSAGLNGTFRYDSITYETVLKGNVEACVGFKNDIFYSDAIIWSRNYNMYLASGYGVNEAMVYANSLGNLYGNTSIQSAVEVFNSEWNLKLGNYANSSASEIRHDSIETDIISNSLERRNILKNIKDTKIANTNLDSDDEVVEMLREYNKNLLNYDYEITHQNSQIISTENNQIENIDYINVTYKIGDFITNSGYVIQINDGNLAAIYENNIDKLLNAKIEPEIITQKTNNYNEIINNNINKILQNEADYEKLKIQEENPYYYYYDLETNKKYIAINYISELDVETENIKACGRKYIEI